MTNTDNKEFTWAPYTYLVGWSNLNLWYYGSKTGKHAYPDLFWQNYFTSSQYVNDIRKIVGEPDIIEIRKIFKTNQEALTWEYNVLKKLKAVYSDKWLNRNNGGMKNFVKAFTKSGKEIVTSPDDIRFNSKEIFHHNKSKIVVKDKDGNTFQISDNDLRYINGELVGATTGTQIGKNNPFYGKTHSKETKLKISQSRKNCIPWNKGKHVTYGTKWQEAIKNKNMIGKNNPSFGSKWYGHPTELIKCYVKNGDMELENKLIENGWKEKPDNFMKRKSITKNIKDYIND